MVEPAAFAYTVTPPMGAPDASFTTPEMMASAASAAGAQNIIEESARVIADTLVRRGAECMRIEAFMAFPLLFYRFSGERRVRGSAF